MLIKWLRGNDQAAYRGCPSVGMGAGSLWGVDPDAQPKREPGEGLSQGASLHYFLGLHFAPLFMEGHFQIYHVRKGGLDC